MQWLGLTQSNAKLNAADAAACLSLLAMLIAVSVRRYQAKKALLPLPPSPPKQGHLDHTGVVPKAFEYCAYEKWAKELDTDILHLQLGKNTVVVLSSYEAISEVFERNAAIYSDRQLDTMKRKVVGWNWPIPSLEFGERWKRGRALFQKHLHPFNRKLFQPRQLAFVRGQLLPQLLEGPDDIISVVRHFSGGLSLAVAYGIKIQAKNDPYVKIGERAMASIAQLARPGRFLVDKYPILRFVPSWFPGAEWKRQGLIWRQWQEDLRIITFEEAMRNYTEGTLKPSFVEEALHAYEDTPPSSEQLDLIKDVSGIIFGAGGDTTAATISTPIIAMLCYPEVQEKARAELDRIVGPNRLPTFEDKKELTYITAIAKEVLRWQNPTPMAIPHLSSEEGEYKGYRIPKGTLVFGNVWALMHDANEFPEPMKFNPERFLNPDGSLNEGIRDPESIVFGFGRRMCPGRHIAISALWMSIASILTAFRIEKGVDANGNLIKPEPYFLPGFVEFPAPFKASMRVRSKEMESLILNDGEIHL